MNFSPKKQQGMTLISMVCVAVVVVSMFLLALNIVPIYMEHGKVKGALDSIKHNDEARNETPEQLTLRFTKLLGVNNVDNVTKDNVTISKLETGGTQIHVQYEVIKKVVGNASILVEFDDTIEIN
jgi:hypothetical protein